MGQFFFKKKSIGKSDDIFTNRVYINRIYFFYVILLKSLLVNDVAMTND